MSKKDWSHLCASRKQGWEFKGINRSLNAEFQYCVHHKDPNGKWVEIPNAGQDIVRPYRYEFSLSELQRIQAEGRYATTVRKDLVEQGIAAFSRRGNVVEFKVA